MKYIYILLFVGFSFSAVAQKSYKVLQKTVFAGMSTRVQKNIDKEMDRAVKDFKKILGKQKNDPMALFGLSAVYSYERYSRKDYFKAWKYFQKADRKQANFTKNDKPVLNQYFAKKDRKRRYKPLISNMKWESDNVEGKLIKFVREENNLDLANRFIEEFPKSKYYENVIHIRNYIEFRTAENANTVEAYDKFIKEYPEAAQFHIAKKKRDKIAYEKAIASNSLAALEEFISKYPDAEQIDSAKKMASVIEFNSAVTKNTVEAMETFISKYPNSIKIPEAKVIKRKLLFTWAKSQNTLEAYNKFVSEYPEGDMYIDIFNLKTRTLGEQIKSNLSNENYAFIRGFDNSQIDDFGGGVVKCPNGEILLVGNTKKTADDLYDVWILALDTQGNLKWSTIIGNQLNDKANMVRVNKNNEIFIAGTTNFKDGTAGRAWVFKINKEGKNLYNQIVDGTEIHHLQLYPDGKALVCGTKTDSKTAATDNYIMKINAKGKKLWYRTYSQKGKIAGTVISSNNTAFVASENWIFALNNRGYLLWDKILTDKQVQAVSLSNNKVVFSGVKGDKLFASAYDFKGNVKWETAFDRIDTANIKATATLSDKSILVCSETADNKLIISKIDTTGAFISSKTFALPEGVEFNGIDTIQDNFALISLTPLSQKDLILFKLRF